MQISDWVFRNLAQKRIEKLLIIFHLAGFSSREDSAQMFKIWPGRSRDGREMFGRTERMRCQLRNGRKLKKNINQPKLCAYRVIAEGE